MGRRCRSDHANLDRIDANVAHHSINLRDHHFGLDEVYRADATCILRGNCGHRRHRVAAEHRHRLDVSLNASAAARIRTCNDEDTRGHRHYSLRLCVSA